MWHVRETGKVHTAYWGVGGMRERHHLEDLGVDEEMIRK